MDIVKDMQKKNLKTIYNIEMQFMKAYDNIVGKNKF